MAVLTQKNIFRLQISIDNLFWVQVLDGEDYFRGIKYYLLLVKSSSLIQVKEEGAAALVVQQEIQILRTLEGVV